MSGVGNKRRGAQNQGRKPHAKKNLRDAAVAVSAAVSETRESDSSVIDSSTFQTGNILVALHVKFLTPADPFSAFADRVEDEHRNHEGERLVAPEGSLLEGEKEVTAFSDLPAPCVEQAPAVVGTVTVDDLCFSLQVF